IRMRGSENRPNVSFQPECGSGNSTTIIATQLKYFGVLATTQTKVHDMNNNYYAILMAGGVGSRFWPVSTTEFPKQFHDMLGSGETLIQKTFSRLSRIIPKQNILILTNEK